MNGNIPTWKEITSHEGWNTLDDNRKNKIREKWLSDIRGSDPDLSDAEFEQLRLNVYRDAISTEQPQPQPRPQLPKQITPPTNFGGDKEPERMRFRVFSDDEKMRSVEGEAQKQRQIEQPQMGQPVVADDTQSEKYWDYNIDTGETMVSDDRGTTWRPASEEEASTISGEIPFREVPSGTTPDQVLLQHNNLNFVDRILNSQDYPVIENEDGTVSTHRMASATIGGQPIVYPTIVERDGGLVQLNDDDAVQYAVDTGEFIPFENPEDAAEFAEGMYKVGMREKEPRIPTLSEAFGAASRMQLEQITEPILHPFKHLAKLSAPLSAVAGGLTELVKDKDRTKAEAVGDALVEGFRSFGDAIATGEIKDASTVQKELTGKTFEEQYGLLWGTLVNIGASCLIDPLIVGTLPLKMVSKIRNIAMGATTAEEAAKILSKVGDKLPPKVKKIVEVASKKLEEKGFHIVRKALPKNKELRALAEGRLATAGEQKMLEAGKAIELPERAATREVIELGGRQRAKLAAAPERKMITKKTITKTKDDILTTKSPPKMTPETSGKPGLKITNKTTAPEAADIASKKVAIDTVDKFVKAGGKITKVPPVVKRTKTIIGKEAAKRAREVTGRTLGIDGEVLRGGVKEGATMSEYSSRIARGNGEGVYLGNIFGAGAKYFNNIVERIKGIRHTPKQGDEFIKKGILSVEKPFEKISKEVGFRVKNMHSRAEAVRSRGVDVMRDIARIGKTGWRGLRKPGAKHKFNTEDLSDIPLAAESKEYFNKLPLETKKRIKPAVDRLLKFFKDARNGYSKYGVDINFKNRLMNNLLEENSKILAKFKAIKRGDIKRMTMRELQKLGIHPDTIGKDFKPRDIKKIKSLLIKHGKDNQAIASRLSKIDYVHIPYAMWFDSIPRSAALKALRIANKHNRKTIAISDLIESGAIKKGDVNVFDIIASYSDRMGKDFALLDLKMAAKQAGLISKKKTADCFVRMDGRKAPLFADGYLNPAFKNWLYDFQQATYNQNIIDKGFSLAKMAQFTRPAFLGFYNMWQHSVVRGLGWLNAKGVADDVSKAIKMMKNHSDDYYEALDNGLKSTPYEIPWDSFKNTVDRFKTTTVGENVKLFAHQNKSVIKPIYETFWNTAWTAGDELPRLITYNYLRRKGMSSFEAAQTAALFHSDYASVPVETRRMLNRIFFTPTFKITMGKLYKEMIKAAYSIPKKALTGKAKDITMQEKVLAKGAVGTVFGIMGGMDFTMTKLLGYERDQFARRYYKMVEDEDGKLKESVVVFANPLTLIPKYGYKAYNVLANKGYRDNRLTKLYNEFKWELHPLYRVGGNIAQNRKDNGDPIFFPHFDSEMMQGLKIATYATSQVVKILDDWTMPEDMDQKKANEIFARDVGFLFDSFSKPMSFKYIRGSKFEHLRDRLEKLRRSQSKTRNQLIKDGLMNPENAKKFATTCLNEQKKLLKLVKDAEEKQYKSMLKSNEISMKTKKSYERARNVGRKTSSGMKINITRGKLERPK
jgi:hypothetical protein